MTTVAKPAVRPACPYFSSGPTAKRPGFSLSQLEDAALGRSHRSKIGKAKLKEAIDLTREALGVPDDYTAHEEKIANECCACRHFHNDQIQHGDRNKAASPKKCALVDSRNPDFCLLRLRRRCAPRKGFKSIQIAIAHSVPVPEMIRSAAVHGKASRYSATRKVC